MVSSNLVGVLENLEFRSCLRARRQKTTESKKIP